MTNRTDHRAAAERMLADADEWAAQAGELRAIDLCDECPDAERCPTPLPSQVARALIEQAVEQAGGGHG